MLCSVKKKVYFTLRRNLALQSAIHAYFTLREKITVANCHRTLLCPKKITSAVQYNPRFRQQCYCAGNIIKVEQNTVSVTSRSLVARYEHLVSCCLNFQAPRIRTATSQKTWVAIFTFTAERSSVSREMTVDGSPAPNHALAHKLHYSCPNEFWARIFLISLILI